MQLVEKAFQSQKSRVNVMVVGRKSAQSVEGSILSAQNVDGLFAEIVLPLTREIRSGITLYVNLLDV